MVKNIVDTYLYYKKQFIILISGLKGTYKTAIAKKLAFDLKLDFIDTCDFIDEDKLKDIEINGKQIKDYNDAYALSASLSYL
jgi:uridine kinase